MKKSVLLFIGVALSIVIIAAVGTTIDDFFMPGSQPGDSGNIEHPDKCDNCHGGYDQAVEPAFNWRGSMMAQAARDPLFYACLAVAEQDAPGVGDMCLRCHTPDGWLNGRCEPTDGSALNNNDREGVQCDFCHKMVKPSPVGTNPFPSDEIYTAETYPRDQEYLATIPLPGSPGNGMYIADSENAKRGPFSDATGRHQMHYSPFHSQSEHCGTCHDVSNPVLIRNYEGTLIYSPEIDGKIPSTSVVKLTFPIERTFSEWRASGYSDPESTDYTTCQDCHMRNVTGKGAKMKDAKVRDNLPLHDFTGGNTFTPLMVKNLWADEVDAAALDAGIERARQQLQSAADLDVAIDGQNVIVTVTNKTGHKLPTGYPEGRRIWINLIAFNGGEIVWESGKYENDEISAINNPKIYHCEPGISIRLANMVGNPSLAGPSLHMALNDTVYFDNRIPPKGSSFSSLRENQSPVVDADYLIDGAHSDATTYTLDVDFDYVEARLMYQTASKEFIEFLNENGGEAGQILHDQWLATGKSTPELMNVAYSGEPAVAYMDAAFTGVSRETNRKKANGIATVHVFVGNTNIDAATVFVEYSGPSSGTLSGTTDGNGEVTFSTRPVNNPSGQWCFTILDVTHADYTYTIPKPFTRECEGLAGTAAKSATIGNIISEPGINIYPNPFTNKLYFEFSREMDEKCLIEVFDVTGRKLDVVFNQMIEAGQQYKVEYAADKVATDLLFYRMQFNEEVITGKVVKR